MTAAERVARGAALLDEKRPGWAAEIDLSKLDLSNNCRCVLGQVFAGKADRTGNFESGFEYADIMILMPLGTPAEFGFDLDRDLLNAMYLERLAGYRSLDRLWIAEIERRRTAVQT